MRLAESAVLFDRLILVLENEQDKDTGYCH